MKTTLDANGQIGIPEHIRRTDHLRAGDLFEVERLTAGHYVISKREIGPPRFTVGTGKDGLPIIRVEHGVITSQQVKELESLTP